MLRSRTGLLPIVLSLLGLSIATYAAHAQRITVIGIDSTRFPEVTADAYFLDANGHAVVASRSDVTVTENGEAREVLRLECPSTEPAGVVSSVLTIDVSGSMSSPGAGATPNIELARAAARAWVDGLPLDGSECAITTFDDRGLISQDFTADHRLLYAAVDKLRPSGGTNYTAGLTGVPAGGLSMVKDGAGRHVVVFLTDGLGGGNEKEILAAAQEADAVIFCVTLGMPAPEVLKTIATRTGGEYYENVTTVDQARTIYQTILNRSLGVKPCKLTWRGEPACGTARKVALGVPARGLSGAFEYKAPRTSIPMITVEPAGLSFDVVRPGATKELSLTITAVNRAVRVERFEPSAPGGPFTLDAPSAPFTLAQGEHRTLKVRYAPTDTAYNFARWMIRSDACFSPSITAAGGSGAPVTPTIKLLAPNGGERFAVGEETTLRWEGVLPRDTVRLEYSTDNGGTWSAVAERAAGGSYRWTVPPTPSDRCLARVAQLARRDPRDSNVMALIGHTDYVMSTNFSRDGSRAVTASWDGTAKIWDARTGRLLNTLVVSTGTNGGRPRRVYYAEFSPNGRTVLTAADGADVGIWDAASGRLLRKLNGKLFNKPDVDGGQMDGNITPDPIFSADGAHVLLRSDNQPTIWDPNTGRKTATLSGHREWTDAATFSPDGRLVATGGRDSTARVWDAVTGRAIATFTEHVDDVTSVAFSPDSKLVASAGRDGRVRIWDATTGVTLQTITPSTRSPLSDRGRRRTPPVDPPTSHLRGVRAIFSPYGANLLVWAGVEIPPIIYDVASGEELRRLEESPDAARSSVGFAVYSPDGARIAVREASMALWSAGSATLMAEYPWDMQMSWMAFSPDGMQIAASGGRKANLWGAGARITQSDASDSLWSIVDARPTAMDVNFGARVLNTTNDSVVVGFIANTGRAPLNVNAVAIAGTHAKDFALVSGMPPYTLAPGERHNMEFRFTPSALGGRTATLRIETGGRTLTQTLRGEGARPQVKIVTPTIDMGTVELGDRQDSTIEAVVKNVSMGPIEIAGITLGGPDTTQFAIVDSIGRFRLGVGETREITVRFAPQRAGRTSAQLVVRHDGGLAYADVFGRGGSAGSATRYTDPTTFRSVAIPNAVVPPKGSIVLGTYDVAGVLAAYVPLDGVMLIAGGGVPFPDDWGGVHGTMYGAYSIGAKVRLVSDSKVDIGIGYQWARSIYDNEITPDSLESSITASTVYSAVSYGDDDRRVSLTGGFALKTHRTFGIGTYEKNAVLVGLGGDYRIGRRWKIAAEALYMQTLGFAPVAVTVRFFSNRYAIDAGIGYLGITTGDGDAPSLKIAPVISYVVRW